MAKNAPFHIKSPVKNFHGCAKGAGHRTVALPLNTPLYPQDDLSLIATHGYIHGYIRGLFLYLHGYP